MPYSHEESRQSHDCDVAIIYARVSSTKQTIEGDGLNSQITRCAEYADRKGYEVVHKFSDDMSGSVLDRPGMKDMLAFLKRYKKATRHVVIIDDISRLARDIETHLKLRSSISEAGGILESPSLEFGEDSDSRLVENLLAVVSQHQRQKNGEQVKNRMRARVLNGYYPFRAPLGYRFETSKGRGKVLVPHEPMASVVKECFEGFASGKYGAQCEIIRYLESLPYFPRDGRGLIRFERVREMFENPVYAGMVHAPVWGISMREGNHEGLVSFETFRRVKEKLNATPLAPTRKDVSKDFILRGFLQCSECGYHLTASWSKGRSKKYPYYHCHNKTCSCRGKTTPRAKLESEVEAVLKTLAPKPNVVDAAREMFKALWARKQAQVEVHATALKTKLAECEKQINGLLERVVDTDNTRIVKTYESKINALEEEKLLIAEKIKKQTKPAKTFDESVRTAIEFLLNPIKPYLYGDETRKRMVLKLAFGAPLVYDRDSGLRTATPSMPFQVLQRVTGHIEDNHGRDYEMVGGNGLEPLTLSV